MNDLGRATRQDMDELLEAAGTVLASGWLVHGTEHAAFESELAEYVGARFALGVGNGTDALELAIRAATPQADKMVVTAANCGGYTTTAARSAGRGLRYADVDAETHVLTPETVAAVADRSVGAVVVTHLYGRAADVAGIAEVCTPLGIKVVEDCAQALGARTAGGRVGSLADVATMSFYPTKNLGAVGDGGAVTTSDAGIAETVSLLRQYGWGAKYRIDATGGQNSRLDELQAAILRVRLRRLDEGNVRRRAIITAYRRAASPRITVLPADGESHTGHLAVVVSAERDALRLHLDDAGVRTDVHYPIPDHRQPAFASEHEGVNLPVTERLAERVLSVPVFPELTDGEVDRVCRALASF